MDDVAIDDGAHCDISVCPWPTSCGRPAVARVVTYCSDLFLCFKHAKEKQEAGRSVRVLYEAR